MLVRNQECAIHGTPPEPAEPQWWGVWCDELGGTLGHWRSDPGDASRPLHTTEAEAIRIARRCNAHSGENGNGWRYEARPYPKETK